MGEEEAETESQKTAVRFRSETGLEVETGGTSGFWKLFRQLPTHVRKRAGNAYHNFFCKNPMHPLLEGEFKLDVLLGIKKHERKVWSVALGWGWRALAIRSERAGILCFKWYWIGSHEAYNRRVGK